MVRAPQALRTAQTERRGVFCPAGEGDANPSTAYNEHPTNACRSPDAGRAAFTMNRGTDGVTEVASDEEEEREDEDEEDDDDYDDGEEMEHSVGGRGERRSSIKAKGKEGTGEERAQRKKRSAGDGFNVNLSGVDLDDETLHQVLPFHTLTVFVLLSFAGLEGIVEVSGGDHGQKRGCLLWGLVEVSQLGPPGDTAMAT